MDLYFRYAYFHITFSKIHFCAYLYNSTCTFLKYRKSIVLPNVLERLICPLLPHPQPKRALLRLSFVKLSCNKSLAAGQFKGQIRIKRLMLTVIDLKLVLLPMHANPVST